MFPHRHRLLIAKWGWMGKDGSASMGEFSCPCSGKCCLAWSICGRIGASQPSVSQDKNSSHDWGLIVDRQGMIQ